MTDDVKFTEGDDVFADIDADPLADTAESDLPEGVAEAELAGDNPSEAPAPGEFLEEPEESDDLDPPLPDPGAVDPPAAEEPPPEPASEPEPAPAPPEPAVPDPEPAPEPEPVAPAPEPAVSDPEPAPEPESDLTAEEQGALAAEAAAAVLQDPPPAPAVESEPAAEPAAPAPEPAKPPAKPRKKAGKSKRKSGKKSDRQVSRPYVVWYQIDEETFKIGAIVEAREVEQAIRKAIPLLKEKTGKAEFKGVAAVPKSNWNPVPVKAAQQVKDVVTIG